MRLRGRCDKLSIPGDVPQHINRPLCMHSLDSSGCIAFAGPTCSKQIAGRLNHLERRVLPRGEWPEWCPACRASGLAHCGRCMGTGQKRRKLGFRLPNVDSSDEEDE